MTNAKIKRIRAVVLFIIISATVSCGAVGKDYVRPDVESNAKWNTNIQSRILFESGDPSVLSDWWKLFGDSILNKIIDKMTAGNMDLKSARYALLASKAKIRQTESSNYPLFEVNGSASSVHYGDDRLKDQHVGSYSAGFDASWQIDLFGGLKREIEAVYADSEAVKEGYRDTLVSLLAETAATYVTARTTQSRLDLAEINIKITEELYYLAEKKYNAGLQDESELKKALYQLEYAKTEVYDLRSLLHESYNRLSVLTGESPGTIDSIIKEKRDIPVTPIKIVTAIPADVIRNRPDIRKKERELAAQTARIGAAKSDMYPKFTLNGRIGYAADNTGSLFDKRSSTMSFGPSFSWAVFDLGSVKQNIKVQTETQKKYFADYESTVLTAFEEVENAMKSFDEEYRKKIQLEKAVAAAKYAYELERKKYEIGLSDYSDVVDVQSTYINYQNSLVLSKGNNAKYLINLYKALGGGWKAE